MNNKKKKYKKVKKQSGGPINIPDRFAPISSIPINYGAKEVPASDYKNQQQWLEEYIQSPRYKDILSKEMPNSDVDKEIARRLRNVRKYPIKEKQVHPKGYGYVRGMMVSEKPSTDYMKYFTSGQEIQIDPDGSTPGTYVDPLAKHIDPYIATHELAHTSTQGNLQLSKFARNLLDEVIAKGMSHDRGDYDMDTRTGNTFDYESDPTEVHARLTELKKLMSDYGIVDPMTEEINRVHIQKAFENPNIRKKDDMKDIMEKVPNIGNLEMLLNSIAQNDMKKTKNGKMLAADGGNLLNTVQGLAPLLNLAVPGLGTGVGMAAGIGQQAMANNQSPSTYQPLTPASNKYGLAMGGSLENLGKYSAEVTANNPNSTDSVELAQAYVDNDEIISKMGDGSTYVFPDDKINPLTGNKYSEDAKKLAKSDAKAEQRSYDPEAKNTLKHNEQIRSKFASVNELENMQEEMKKQIKPLFNRGGILSNKPNYQGKGGAAQTSVGQNANTGNPVN